LVERQRDPLVDIGPVCLRQPESPDDSVYQPVIAGDQRLPGSLIIIETPLDQVSQIVEVGVSGRFRLRLVPPLRSLG
jgi:hypothetical protein